MGVPEDVEEGLEMLVRIQAGILQRFEGRRDVLQGLGELHLGSGVQGKVLQEQPCLGGVRRVGWDPQDVPPDLTRPVELRVIVGNGERPVP